MLQVGFARTDITPPLGTYMAGYFHSRYATGILDPIELNAVAFSDGESKALLITADMLGIGSGYDTKIRGQISARTGVPADHIMTMALHQHTSIYLNPENDNNVLEDHDFLNWLYRKFCDVAQMALDDLSEATAGTAAREADHQLSFVRRYWMKDGTVKTNPGFKHQSEIDRPAADADNTVRLIRFKREGKNDVAVVNFCTHPDVIGGEKFSADWPGFVRRFVEADHEGVSCILINGCQGDTNHIDYIGWKDGPHGPEGHYGHSRFMGRTIADAVCAMWDHTTPRKADRVGAAVTAVYERTRTDGAEEYEKCKAIYDEFQRTGERPADASMRNMAYLRRVAAMMEYKIFYTIRVSAVTLGDIGFFGYAGEPFTRYETAVQKAFPDRFLISACCANGYEGYLPTKEAFDEGGYEATSSIFTPALEGKCESAAIELLKNI